MKKKFFRKFIYPSYLNLDNRPSTIMKNIFWIIVASFLCFVGISFFIKGIFISNGTSGIALSISKIYNDINLSNNHPINQLYSSLFFYIPLIIINIPFFIFAIVKLNKKIVIYSLFFLIIFSLLGIFLGPYSLKNKWLFREIEEIRKVIINNPNSINNYSNFFIISFIGGIFYGLGCVLLYQNKATSAGTDFINIYYSSKLSKGIGQLNIFSSLIILLFCFLFSFFLDKRNTNFLQYLTSPNTLGTFLYIFVVSFIIDFFYPRNQKIVIYLFTENFDKIAHDLKKFGYRHSFSKITVTGTYSNNEKNCFLGVMTYFEFVKIREIISKNDQNAFMFWNRLGGLEGKFLKLSDF